MPTIASDLNKKVIYKRQDGLGQKASAGSAQILRFTKADINLRKPEYESNEVRQSQQQSDVMHGVRSCVGVINGELSPTTYTKQLEDVLRGTFASTNAYSAGTDVTAAATAPQIVDQSGGLLTAGLKVGMIVRFTGFAASANNNRNFQITALTAQNMSGYFTDGTTMTAEAAGASITITPQGKGLSIPQSGHTKNYGTLEIWQSDVSLSEQYTDVILSPVNISMPATGISTIDIGVSSLDKDNGTAQYFTSPTAETTTNQCDAVNGLMVFNGSDVAYITSVNLSIDGGSEFVGGVCGSNVDPDILRGDVKVTGTITVLFTDSVMRDAFENETESSLIFTASNTKTATGGIMSFVMPRVKINSFDKAGDRKKSAATITFRALENTAGGSGTATNASAITIYDTEVA